MNGSMKPLMLLGGQMLVFLIWLAVSVYLLYILIRIVSVVLKKKSLINVTLAIVLSLLGLLALPFLYDLVQDLFGK